MESRLNSSLLSDLSRFLRNPVIKVELCPSDEVAALQLQITDLMSALDQERVKYSVLEVKYADEVGRCLHYEDLLRYHSIKFR